MNTNSSPPPSILSGSLGFYAIDARSGFVPGVDPLNRLPVDYEAWERIGAELSPLIRSRSVRAELAALPMVDPLALATGAERERALLILTVFANAWVWGGAEPNLRIPSQLAQPLCALARTMDRPPIVHYASMALNNWRRIDTRRALSVGNARMQIQFLGGVDEDWFFIASIGVEIEGAPLLALAHAATEASHRLDDDALAGLLGQIAAGMDPVIGALERTREWCDPYVFYHRVRPFLAGWPNSGVVYEGVSETPQKYVGGSAGQSSLIQAIDALLGVSHSAQTDSYLRGVRNYMPVPHRRFLTDIENNSRVRRCAESGPATLRAAYNAAVAQVDLFRRRHIALAHDYISKPSGMAADEKGTGGTSFADFLRDAQLATARTTL